MILDLFHNEDEFKNIHGYDDSTGTLYTVHSMMKLDEICFGGSYAMLAEIKDTPAASN